MTDVLHPSSGVKRVAVVTGASGGIGRAIALALAADGYRVWGVARRAGILHELAVESGGRIRPWPMDVTRPDLTTLVSAVRSEGKGLDALIHCAGQMATGSLLDTDDAAVARCLFEVNTVAPHRLTRALMPLMGRGGTVVFLNSSRGLDAGTRAGPYAMSKHALRALADAMREEANTHGVRVTSVYAGRTATPLQENLYAERGQPYDPQLLLQPEDISQMVSSLLGLPAAAEITDVSVRSSSPYH